MAEIILSEQPLEGFVLDESVGLYFWSISPELFQLVEGESYTVKWDDDPEYTCSAEFMTLGDISGIGLGNPGLVGIGDNNDIPFLFEYITGYNACYTNSELASHKVNIWLVTEDDSQEQQGVDIVLYDRTGAPVTYKDKDYIITDTPEEGVQAIFTYGEVVEGTEVVLELSDGDQVLNVPKGYLVKEATILKPETLLPENIKKNVEIAGIVGTLIGEGVEKTVDLDMSGGDQVIDADEETLMSRVIVRKPDTLIPENIAKGIEIGGIIGTLGGIDELTEGLKYFAYQIDEAAKVVILCKVLYDKLYAETGSYDVYVPDKVSGYDVVIMSS